MLNASIAESIRGPNPTRQKSTRRDRAEKKLFVDKWLAERKQTGITAQQFEANNYLPAGGLLQWKKAIYGDDIKITRLI